MSKIDHSYKSPTLEDALKSLLGTKISKKTRRQIERQERFAGPWRHDFHNSCIKCNKKYHLQKHHITYNPPLEVFLCIQHHKQITMINTLGSQIAHGSLKYRETYTNKLRVVLWKWFLKTPIQAITKPLVRDALKETRFSENLGTAGEQPDKTPLEAWSLFKSGRNDNGCFGKTPRHIGASLLPI